MGPFNYPKRGEKGQMISLSLYGPQDAATSAWHIVNVETSYFTQLKICYLMTTFHSCSSAEARLNLGPLLQRDAMHGADHAVTKCLSVHHTPVFC